MEAEETLFRIAQEALNNVVKHAKAERVEICLRTDSETLYLSLKDDGVGFLLSAFASPEYAEAKTRPIGLAIMRERAKAMEGQLRVVFSPGNGTIIEAVLPLRKEKDQ